MEHHITIGRSDDAPILWTPTPLKPDLLIDDPSGELALALYRDLRERSDARVTHFYADCGPSADGAGTATAYAFCMPANATPETWERLAKTAASARTLQPNLHVIASTTDDTATAGAPASFTIIRMDGGHGVMNGTPFTR